MDANSTPFTLYFTLYLRTVNKVNKYHWSLYTTDRAPPSGYLLHATDTGRTALELYKEVREVSDPRKSKSLVVCLKIANAPLMQALDRNYCPWGEAQWTCHTIERCCQLTADSYISRMGKAEIFNSLGWIGQPTVPMDIDSAWYGSSPMETETSRTGSRSGYYGTKPMVTETHGRRTL